MINWNDINKCVFTTACVFREQHTKVKIEKNFMILIVNIFMNKALI